MLSAAAQGVQANPKDPKEIVFIVLETFWYISNSSCSRNLSRFPSATLVDARIYLVSPGHFVGHGDGWF